MAHNGWLLTAVMAAIVTFGFSGVALSHGPAARGGNPYCGWYYGCGAGSGYGMGPRTMGPGMMGPGYGLGFGYGLGPGIMAPLRQDLTVVDVGHIMAHRLAWGGANNLKLDTVEEKDEDTIVAEIVTKNGAVVQRLAVDRHTGSMQPVQ